MDTLANIREAVQDDLTVGSESTLFSPTLIDRFINRSYRKCASFFPWPEMQDAKRTVTVASQEYYDYPDTWRSNSIWKVKVDGDRYGEGLDGSPLTFDDYLNWREDYPDNTDKKWANQERRYFITPTPTVADLVICIWGVKNTIALSADSDTTYFSYSTPEVNEAIELEAVAMLKNKNEMERSGEFRSSEAKQILSVAWGKIAKEAQKYEKNQPMWNVGDFFGNTHQPGTTLTGRF